MAKRYVKRYYIRPQNIFCSNKAEILNALVKEVGENNCSVYSLKALDDHDDVHLLQPKDIIYYYDDGILYDKNHVKVMDYDLNVKHEEERKKFGNVDAISDETFDAEYEDRLTEELDSYDAEVLKKAVDNGEEINLGWDSDNPEVGGFADHGYYSDTEYVLWQNSAKKYVISEWHHSNDGDLLEGDDYEFNSFSEVIEWINHKNFSASNFDIPAKYWEEDDEFSQDFDDIDVYGRNLTEAAHNTFVCCICGEESEGYGNNPSPVKEEGECCDACNRKFVIPARLGFEIED